MTNPCITAVITQSQRDAILAVLRLLQRSLEGKVFVGADVDAHIQAIYTSEGETAGLTTVEIDALCESLNAPQSHAAAPSTLWSLLIEHEHGHNLTLHATRDDADAAAFAFVAEWWPREFPRKRMPADRSDAIQKYFEDHDSETYVIDSHPLPN
jgi:hypothetical protein